MTNRNLINQLKQTIVEGNEEEAVKLTKKSLDANISYKEILDSAIIQGANEIGDLYEKEEYFLADMLMAGDAINASMELLNPIISKAGEESLGTIVIGTVEGDVHDIGKSLIISLLQGQGFRVIDLGVEVKPEVFLDVSMKANPDLIGLSGLLTASISKMIETVSLLKENRIGAKVIVGGGILSEETCKMIGADEFAKDGWEGIKKIRKLVGA